LKAKQRAGRSKVRSLTVLSSNYKYAATKLSPGTKPMRPQTSVHDHGSRGPKGLPAVGAPGGEHAGSATAFSSKTGLLFFGHECLFLFFSSTRDIGRKRIPKKNGSGLPDAHRARAWDGCVGRGGFRSLLPASSVPHPLARYHDVPFVVPSSARVSPFFVRSPFCRRPFKSFSVPHLCKPCLF